MNEALPLRDIHAAADPGWWPLAWGWWCLAAAILVALTFAFFRFRHQRLVVRRRNALREQADRLLADQTSALAGANEFLRRLLVHYAHHRDRASSVGAAWARFLADPDPARFDPVARAVALGSYRPQAPDIPNSELRALVDQWIDIVIEERHGA